MSVVPLVRSLQPAGEESASFRVAREAFTLAASLIEGAARELRVRRDMDRLAEFDDRMLRDIGLTRSEIEGVVRRGRDGL
jgi:uncharacterized protein YjiS (DUF1127 family)